MLRHILLRLIPFIACRSLANLDDYQGEKEYGHYIGGIVGYIMAGDNTMIRSCYSSAAVEGRQPGQILGEDNKLDVKKIENL